jgi:hypothetical protein
MSASSVRSLFTSAVALVVFSSSVAFAQGAATEEPAPAGSIATPAVLEFQGPARWDIGLSGGFNNPAGVYGVETSFRFIDHLSVGAAAGNGAWGIRVSPLARVYPLGASRLGLFLEGGASFNLGGTADLKTNGQVVQQAEMRFTPVVDAALGYRFSLGRHGWIALRAGYGIKLGGNDNYGVVGGGAVNPLLGTVLELAQPGGFMGGLSAGFSIL